MERSESSAGRPAVATRGNEEPRARSDVRRGPASRAEPSPERSRDGNRRFEHAADAGFRAPAESELVRGLDNHCRDRDAAGSEPVEYGTADAGVVGQYHHAEKILAHANLHAAGVCARPVSVLP